VPLLPVVAVVPLLPVVPVAPLLPVVAVVPLLPVVPVAPLLPVVAGSGAAARHVRQLNFPDSARASRVAVAIGLSSLGVGLVMIEPEFPLVT